MSVMICEQCDNPVDTDWDLDGTWTGTGYICESCTEANEENPVVTRINALGASLLGETPAGKE